MTTAEKIQNDLINLALANIVIDSGGELVLTDETFAGQPIGFLSVFQNSADAIEAVFVQHNDGPRYGNPCTLALLCIVHHAGDKLVIPSRALEKMPNGQLGYRFFDGGIVFQYQQSETPKIIEG